MGGGKVGYPHVFANPAVESAIQDQRKKDQRKKDQPQKSFGSAVNIRYSGNAFRFQEMEPLD